MTTPRPDLSDPVRAASAWGRFRMLMRWAVLVAIAAVLVAFYYLWASGDTVTIHMLIATAAGVALSVLLGAALMGLVFLSNGSGHDESARGRSE